MGIKDADVGTLCRASARRWGRPLYVVGTEIGAATLDAGNRLEACPAKVGAGSSGAWWAVVRSRAMWLEVLAVAAAAPIALEFIRPVAYQLPALRATAESLITVLALLAALLFRAQFAHTRRLRDLILFGALVTFTAVELVFGVLPAALELHSSGQSGAALQSAQLLIAAAIAAAALTPSNKLVAWDRRPVASALALSLVAFGAAELCGLLIRSELIVVTARPVTGIGHALGHPVALIVVVLTCGLLAVAAVGLARRGKVERDDALTLLAGGVLLLAAAKLFFLPVPWFGLQWITPREGLRVLAFGLIAAAAARQERAVRARMVRAAEIAERQRVARDLHDGIAQDLAFIAAHGAWMAKELGAEHPVTVAARRALAVSRGTISDLSDSKSVTPRDALEAIAYDLRGRYQMSIAVDADLEAERLHPDSREHVLRIAREAITNAGRHGRAKNVLVSLRQTRNGLALRVRDDGCGLRGVTPSGSLEGFGLRSMRERAATLGGHLTVRERSTGGTDLEVTLP